MNTHYVGEKGSVIVSPLFAIIMDQKEKITPQGLVAESARNSI